MAFFIIALFGGIVIVLWFGAGQLQAGEITAGELTRFVLYTTFVAGAMGQFADLYSQLQKAVGASQRVRELLREAPEFDVGASSSSSLSGCCSLALKSPITRHGPFLFIWLMVS